MTPNTSQSMRQKGTSFLSNFNHRVLTFRNWRGRAAIRPTCLLLSRSSSCVSQSSSPLHMGVQKPADHTMQLRAWTRQDTCIFLHSNLSLRPILSPYRGASLSVLSTCSLRVHCRGTLSLGQLDPCPRGVGGRLGQSSGWCVYRARAALSAPRRVPVDDIRPAGPGVWLACPPRFGTAIREFKR
jgi:hypothetical protein